VSALTRQERLPARDEVDEVAPGVLRVQVPIFLTGLGHVNCYVLEDGRGVTLVDPGLPDPLSNADLVAKLAGAGIPARRIHTVVVTHSHPDHFGGAGRLKVEHGCGVVAHRDFRTPFDATPEDDLRALEIVTDDLTDGDDPDDVPLPPEVVADHEPGGVNPRLARVLYGTGPIPTFAPRATPWGEEGFRPGPGELEAMRAWDDLSKRGLLSLTPTERVDDDQVVTLGRREWRVLHTPGHTGDHICLFDPVDGVLLSGDHVLPTITPHISGMTAHPDSLAEFVAALRRVAAVEGVRTVLPAHGLPFHDLRGRVEAIVEHHEERLDVLRGIARDLGTATVRDYSHRLFQERSWGPMAESETYAHLEHLRLAGEMSAELDPDGRSRYRPVDTKSE
jgi:glyoxylase-like metal-dependent hydrolase (beta-lactamase superfamily II)